MIRVEVIFIGHSVGSLAKQQDDRSAFLALGMLFTLFVIETKLKCSLRILLFYSNYCTNNSVLLTLFFTVIIVFLSTVLFKFSFPRFHLG